MNRYEPIRYTRRLDEETVGQAVLAAACMAVRKRLVWRRTLGMTPLEFKQEIACRIVARVARFVPRLRRNGRMMRLEEYAYVAACFALLDILRVRTRRVNVDALDAPDRGLGARVPVEAADMEPLARRPLDTQAEPKPRRRRVAGDEEEFQGKSLRDAA